MKIKYPKFTLLILTFILAYLLIASNDLTGIRELISHSGMLGIFLAGGLFTYGFTTATATAIFLIMSDNHDLLMTALIGGMGSVIGDLIIFKFIRSSFKDEIKKASREKIIKEANHAVPVKFRHYIRPLLGGMIIASPFPDEIGVGLLATDKRISQKMLIVISYIFNTLGIYLILLAGSLR
jgi:hypothetical protein